MYEVKHYVCSMCFFFFFIFLFWYSGFWVFFSAPPPQTRKLMSFTMNRFLFSFF